MKFNDKIFNLWKYEISMRNLTIVFMLSLFVYSVFPLVNAEISSEDVFNNVEVDLNGPGINRVWNKTFVSVTINNFNKEVPITIKNITILNFKNETILFEEVDFISQPVGHEKETVDDIFEMRRGIGIYDSLIVPFMIFYMPLNKRAALEIKEKEFHRSFKDLNVDDFNPVMDENMTVYVHVGLYYENKQSIKIASHSTMMAQPLPVFH